MESKDNKKYRFRMETEEEPKTKKKKPPQKKKLENYILEMLPKKHHGRDSK